MLQSNLLALLLQSLAPTVAVSKVPFTVKSHHVPRFVPAVSALDSGKYIIGFIDS
ncbi:hypothetical protein HOG21_01525 [bacterium]|nr:hypothetical protein [bacterium]